MVDPYESTPIPSPDKFFDIQQYRDYSRALDLSVERLRSAQVRVSAFGRLEDARRSLGRVAFQGKLPTKRRELVALSDALSDAMDFHDVVRCFGSDLGKMAKDIELSAKGSLGNRSSQAEAQRLQSQLWLGSLLRMAGYEPALPNASIAAPDFLIEEGLSTYGVEIKRPDSIRSAPRLLKKASRQLRDFGVQGAIMIDLSAAAGFHALAWSKRDRLEARAANARRRFRVAATKLRHVILDEVINRMRPGFEHVMALFIIARTTLWVEGPPSGMTVLAIAWPHSFIRRVRDVRYHHSVNISKKLVEGLNRAGYPFAPFGSVGMLSPNLPRTWRW